MSNKNLHKQIEDQQKVIQFLAEKYKQDTGCEISLPQTWSNFLGVEEEKAPIYEYQQEKPEPYEMEKKPEFESFLQALSSLNLPQKKPDTKKGSSSSANKFSSSSSKDQKPGAKKQITTNFNPSNPFHMIEKIDLSNYAGKKFTRASMREFVESIADMRCLHTVILRNNGIDDTFTEELEALVNNWKIQSLDLSNNNIGKQGALALSKALKDNGGHLEWLDLSRNNFGDDYSAVNSICMGLKSQRGLHHFGLTVNTNDPKKADFSLSEGPTKLLVTMPSLRSIALVDSKINHTAITTIYNVLTHQGNHITGLSFRFCFLDTRSVYLLSKAIAINRTLVKLDLSNNGLSPITGVYIVKNLKNNITLTDLNLSKNGLNDDFAEALAETLTHNEILWRVDISHNPIGEVGGHALLKAIRESNDSLESLGDDFAANSASMGVLNVEEIRKLLKQNRVSKEIRSKLLYEGRNTKGEDPKNLTLSQLNYTNSQSFFDAEIEDYKLLKPILFTNELFPKKTKSRLWNI